VLLDQFSSVSWNFDSSGEPDGSAIYSDFSSPVDVVAAVVVTLVVAAVVAIVVAMIGEAANIYKKVTLGLSDLQLTMDNNVEKRGGELFLQESAASRKLLSLTQIRQFRHEELRNIEIHSFCCFQTQRQRRFTDYKQTHPNSLSIPFPIPGTH
jgi:hypothetical protein